jgi:phosphoribosyl-ATP pyrophosphohydrolase
MNSPLSQNELVILDRQMAMVARHLSEIASLLESRQGQTNDHAVTARIIEEGFAHLARKIHNQTVQVAQELPLASKSQTA